MNLKLKSAADAETEYTNPEPAAGGENISVNLKPAAGAQTKYTNREAATGGQKKLQFNMSCTLYVVADFANQLGAGAPNAFVQNALDPINEAKRCFGCAVDLPTSQNTIPGC